MNIGNIGKKTGLVIAALFCLLSMMTSSVTTFAADDVVSKREKYGLVIKDYPDLPGQEGISKTGYNFDGWYTSPQGGVKVDERTYTTPNRENTDLYAHWKPHKYNLTFNDGRESRSSGTLPGTVQVRYDCAGSIPSTGTLGPKRGSIRFDPNGGSGGATLYSYAKLNRWSTLKNDTGKARGIDYLSFSNGHTFPVWNRSMSLKGSGTTTELISFLGKDLEDGATLPLYAQYDGDVTNITAPNASRTNWAFDGWYTAPSGGSRVGSSGSEIGNVRDDRTYYAHWRSVIVNVDVSASVQANGHRSSSTQQLKIGGDTFGDQTITFPNSGSGQLGDAQVIFSGTRGCVKIVMRHAGSGFVRFFTVNGTITMSDGRSIPINLNVEVAKSTSYDTYTEASKEIRYVYY